MPDAGLGYAARRQHQHRPRVVSHGLVDPQGDLGANALGLNGIGGKLRLGEHGEPLPAVAGVDADGNRVAGPHAGDGTGRAFDIGRVDVVACDDDHVLGAAADVQAAVFVEVAEVAGM